MLTASERSKPVGASQARGSTREQYGTGAARQHAAGRFTSHQESRESAQFPYLAVYARGGFSDAEADVAADIEYGDGKRPDVPLDRIQKLYDLFLVARVGMEAARTAAGRLDCIDQFFQITTPARCDDM